MDYKDNFKLLVGAYAGIEEMDDFNLKIYILNDIEKIINDFIEQNKDKDFNFKLEENNIKDNMDLKTKLQDSLIVLNQINGPLDLVIMIKRRLKELS